MNRGWLIYFSQSGTQNIVLEVSVANHQSDAMPVLWVVGLRHAVEWHMSVENTEMGDCYASRKEPNWKRVRLWGD